MKFSEKNLVTSIRNRLLELLNINRGTHHRPVAPENRENIALIGRQKLILNRHRTLHVHHRIFQVVLRDEVALGIAIVVSIAIAELKEAGGNRELAGSLVDEIFLVSRLIFPIAFCERNSALNREPNLIFVNTVSFANRTHIRFQQRFRDSRANQIVVASYAGTTGSGIRIHHRLRSR